jgi:4-amino-4-deoxy-L-arabinose transferase-like glycosyltransferase
MFKALGTGLLALTLLKYVIIALTFWFTYLVSGQLFQHVQTRYFATFAYLLMPSFAWHMHQGFTHTILLGFGIILSLHALLSLKNNPSLNNYLYVGLAFGIGLMGKYSFLLFMIPMLVAALTIDSFKKILVDKKILFTIGVFLLIIGPHVYWLSQHYQEIFLSIDQKLQVNNNNLLIDRIKSVGTFSSAAIAFVIPFALVFIVNSWRQLFNTDKRIERRDIFILLNRFYLVIIASVIILALFVSMPHFKVRWFHPLMMIFPLWLLSRTERKDLWSKSIMHWFYGIVIIFTILVISIRLLQVTVGPDLERYSRLNRPMVETLNKLPDHLMQNSIIKTQDEFLGAHLLSVYHDNNIIINNVHYQNNIKNDDSKCLLLWDNNEAFSKPSVETSSLSTWVADNEYKLFYALMPNKNCL